MDPSKDELDKLSEQQQIDYSHLLESGYTPEQAYGAINPPEPPQAGNEYQYEPTDSERAEALEQAKREAIRTGKPVEPPMPEKYKRDTVRARDERGNEFDLMPTGYDRKGNPIYADYIIEAPTKAEAEERVKEISRRARAVELDVQEREKREALNKVRQYLSNDELNISEAIKDKKIKDEDLRKLGVPQRDIDIARGKLIPAPSREESEKRVEAIRRTASIVDQKRALSKLRDYGSEVKGFEITRYLHDNPGDIETLRKAGFRDSDIETARKESEMPIPKKTVITAKEAGGWRRITPWREDLGETVFSSARRGVAGVEQVVAALKSFKDGTRYNYVEIQKLYDYVLSEMGLDKNFVAPKLILHKERRIGENWETAANYDPFKNVINVYDVGRKLLPKGELIHELSHAVTIPFDKGRRAWTIDSWDDAVRAELTQVYFATFVYADNPNYGLLDVSLKKEMAGIYTGYMKTLYPHLSEQERSELFERLRREAKEEIGYTGPDYDVEIDGILHKAPNGDFGKANSIIAKYNGLKSKPVYIKPEDLSKPVEAAASTRVLVKIGSEGGGGTSAEQRQRDEERVAGKRDWELSEDEWQRGKTKLPDEQWISSADLENIRKTNPKQHEILLSEGYESYYRQTLQARATLAKYQTIGHPGEYDLANILLGKNEKEYKAVALLFKPEDIEAVRAQYLGKLTMGVSRENQDRLDNILLKGMGGLAVASRFAQGTPSGYDDALVYGVLGALAGAGIAKKAIDDYRSRNKTSPKPENVILINRHNGLATPLNEIIKYTPPAEAPEWHPGKLTGKAQENLPVHREDLGMKPKILPALKVNRGTQLIPPEIKIEQERVLAVQADIAVMIDPAIAWEGAGLMKAQAALETSQRNLRRTIPSTIDVDWDKVLQDAIKAKRKIEVERVFEPVKRRLETAEINAYQARRYGEAYREYLRRRAALEAAKKAYIESLNPVPLRGNLTASDLETIADMKLKDLSRSKTSTSVKTATLTEAQAEARARAQEQTRTQAQTKTQTQTKTQAKTATRTATRTATQSRTATRAATRTAARTATRTAALSQAKAIPLRIPLKLPRLPKGNDRYEAGIRQLIKETGGVTRRQGQLNGKDVWHVFLAPYKNSDYLVVTGKRPVGASEAKGTGSGYVATVRGKAPAMPTRIDMGGVDVILTPVGRNKVKVSFSSDPKQQTTGQITLGNRAPALTDRAALRQEQRARLSQRFPRISPRLGKLR